MLIAMTPEDVSRGVSEEVSPETVLERCVCESVFGDKRDFYPEGILQEAITERFVKHYLWDEDESLCAEDQELVAFYTWQGKEALRHRSRDRI